MQLYGIDIPTELETLKATARTSATASLLPGDGTTNATAAKSVSSGSPWRGQLRQASFRGVPFYVETDEQEGGRRAHTHEFACRDLPFTEDMGRKARAFTVDAYVIGSGYMAARDALLKALEEEGPGLLVVPWMPERQVVCTGYRKREAQREGGLARFSLTFAERGATESPTGSALPGVVTGGLADDMLEKMAAVLNSSISIAGMPLPVQADALAAMQQLGEQVAASATILNMGAGIPAALAELQNLDVTALAGLLPATLLAPYFSLGAAIQNISGAYGSGAYTGAQYRAYSAAMLGVAAASLVVSVPAGAGTVRTAVARNRQALAAYQRGAAVAEAARAAVLARPESRQDALALRDELTEAMDQVLEETTDDGVFAACTSLRTAAVQALSRAAGEAPELRTVTQASVLPALALAHQVLPDADATSEEAQILARNAARIRHPGFVPPGELEYFHAV